MGADSVVMGLKASGAMPNTAKVKADNSYSSKTPEEKPSESSFSSILRQQPDAKAASSSSTKTPESDKSQAAAVSDSADTQGLPADQNGNPLQLAGDLLPLQPTALIGLGQLQEVNQASVVVSSDALAIGLQEELSPISLINAEPLAGVTSPSVAVEGVTTAISYSLQANASQRGLAGSSTKSATSINQIVLGESALADSKNNLAASQAAGVDDQSADRLISNPLVAAGTLTADKMVMAKAMLMSDKLSLSADGKMSGDVMTLANQLVTANGSAAGSSAVSFSLAQLDNLAVNQAATATTFQTAIATQVANPNWGDTVMQRVMWMSSQNIQSAEIHLDPPELGALMVKINTQHDQTTVAFSSPHAVVRDALDQSLPKLRDMMEQQGLDLGRVDVFGQSRQQTSENGGDQESSSAQAMAGDELISDISEDRIAQEQVIGLVNAYA